MRDRLCCCLSSVTLSPSTNSWLISLSKRISMQTNLRVKLHWYFLKNCFYLKGGVVEREIFHMLLRPFHGHDGHG